MKYKSFPERWVDGVRGGIGETSFNDFIVSTASGDVPLPEPTTANFTSAEFSPGFAGSTSTTKNAARIYMRAGTTLWAGWISGNTAKLTANSDFGANDGLISVSVDGGAFANASRSGGVYTLFQDLPHAAHYVEIRPGNAFATAAYILSSGNVLEVTGQPPSIMPASPWITAASLTDNVYGSAAFIPNTVSFVPALQAQKGAVYGSNVGSIRISGSFTRLIVALNGDLRSFDVSKNGDAPTRYTMASEANKPLKSMVIQLDGSNSTYNIWDDGCDRSGGGHLAVCAIGAPSTISEKVRLDQYGDSITFGTGPGATPVDVETMRVAASLGYVGSTTGVGGITIAGLKTLLDTVLPLRTVTADDVAVLAIGRNNVPTINSTNKTDYGICIDKLLDKGYGKVICRGVLPTPSGDNVWASANAELESVVTDKADSRVVWLDTSTWTGYGSADATHPTASGYVTLAGYAIPAYTILI